MTRGQDGGRWRGSEMGGGAPKHSAGMAALKIFALNREKQRDKAYLIARRSGIRCTRATTAANNHGAKACNDGGPSRNLQRRGAPSFSLPGVPFVAAN